jgi:4-aminobutyrate aminotransferase / (S)-3-amino-2-methylpropionate transaminase / 5-aminovalerate transaminase
MEMSDQFGDLLPKMVVEPPGPRSMEMAKRLMKYETPAASAISRGDIPVFWEQAQGSNIIDVDGNRYIDVTGGFFVTAVGHANRRVVEAVQKQSGLLMHSMGCVNPNVPRVELVEKLAEIAPGDLEISFVSNTGSEAVDMALKTARLYTGKNTVIAFQGGFHGKTFGSLAVTSKNYFREPWQPLLTGAVHVPYAYCYRCAFGMEHPQCNMLCAHYLDHILGNPSSGVTDVAAIIIEPLQGLGGVIIPPPGYLKRVYEICRAHGVLFIADEIITGFGRTGKLFGVDHSGIVPDMMTLGKGMASGFPVSAMITTRPIADCWGAEQHTSTFVGHPVGCAAALACIEEILENKLVERSAEMGTWLKSELEELMKRHPLIGDVRGLGMTATIELVKDRKTKEPATQESLRLVNQALRRGIMATLRGGEYGNCIRMAPPLNIKREQLEFAIQALDESLTVVEDGE